MSSLSMLMKKCHFILLITSIQALVQALGVCQCQCCCNVLLLTIFPRAASSQLPRDRLLNYVSKSSLNANPMMKRQSLEADPTMEVIGASGRIGSLFLKEHGAMAVPRGIIPGCLSFPTEDAGIPIVVCTPCNAWRSLHQLTSKERRNDLVWVGNGLLPDFAQNETVILPHFAVLMPNDNAITTLQSPPTFVYGKHATLMCDVLSRRGIHVIQNVESWTLIQQFAAQKLLWASCFWLLCHDQKNSGPLTVSQVLSQKQPQLEQLVRELWPAFQELVNTSMEETDSVQDILSYFTQYSMSMPDAIPSKSLALAELQHRNGVFFRSNQPLHSKLLKRVVGVDSLPQYQPHSSDSFAKLKQQVYLPDAKLVCFGTPIGNPSLSSSVQSVIVVGGGIIGSSIARALIRHGLSNVTVLDPTPTGRTSPASWAWLNANQKSPLSYKWLNQLGMRAWRFHPMLKHLPSWCGCLVCFREKLKEDMGGYCVEGPLNTDRVKDIEAEAAFPNEGYVYFYPDEGSVDPCQAVRILRGNSDDNHDSLINRISNEIVISLIRDETRRVVGVKTQRLDRSNSDKDRFMTRLADVVVVAAGASSADEAFGDQIPLVPSPGQVSFANPRVESTLQHNLTTILVDTIRESHILQRKDGSLVVGGGLLQVGGSSVASDSSDSHASQEDIGNDGHMQLDKARHLAPAVLSGSVWTHSEKAVRPMPKDGLPIVGFQEEGLYRVVTHSGVTLSLILGQLAAVEICERLALEVLQNYRPSRFDKELEKK